MPEHVGSGRKRRYCSDACRQAAHRASQDRRADVAAYRPDPDPAITELVALFAPGSPPPSSWPRSEIDCLTETLDAFGYEPIVTPIHADQFGRITDGWLVLAALDALGIEPVIETYPVASDRELLVKVSAALMYLGALRTGSRCRDNALKGIGL